MYHNGDSSSDVDMSSAGPSSGSSSGGSGGSNTSSGRRNTTTTTESPRQSETPRESRPNPKMSKALSTSAKR